MDVLNQMAAYLQESSLDIWLFDRFLYLRRLFLWENACPMFRHVRVWLVAAFVFEVEWFVGGENIHPTAAAVKAIDAGIAVIIATAKNSGIK
ncbi:hypothetical protein ACFFK0_01460 [Paenibacillus chartarius]|uniref:Uncharacterized protein n=1 Tax=Paenibacillus chartarius TaxID=747481 RepID=A0ABV6DEP7_9BACL